MRSLAYYLVASVPSIIDAHGGRLDDLREAAVTAQRAATAHRNAGVYDGAAEWAHAALKIEVAADRLDALIAA